MYGIIQLQIAQLFCFSCEEVHNFVNCVFVNARDARADKHENSLSSHINDLVVFSEKEFEK